MSIEHLTAAFNCKRFKNGARLLLWALANRASDGKPILKELGLDGGAHAFRHGNATMLDSLHATMAVRQERLGHVDAKTTMGYTHIVTADDIEVAGKLGALLDKEFFAQDLPKLPLDRKTASDEFAEAV